MSYGWDSGDEGVNQHQEIAHVLLLRENKILVSSVSMERKKILMTACILVYLCSFLFVWIFVCFFVDFCLLVWISVCDYFCLFACVDFCLFVWISVCVDFCLRLCVCVCLCGFLLCLLVWISVCFVDFLFVCLLLLLLLLV